jgi:hypothetical protein
MESRAGSARDSTGVPSITSLAAGAESLLSTATSSICAVVTPLGFQPDGKITICGKVFR